MKSPLYQRLGRLAVAVCFAVATLTMPVPAGAVTTASFYGVVVDGHGSALQGATVTVSQQDDESNWAVQGSAVTDASGAFQITVAAGTYRLGAVKIGYSSYLEDNVVYNGVTPVHYASGDIVLEEYPAAFSGTVTVLGTSTKVAGAIVRAIASDSSVDVQTTTDANGDYSLGAPAGTYKLIVSKSRYAPAEQDGITFDGTHVVDHDVELEAYPLAFHGTVTDADSHAPIEGVKVHARHLGTSILYEDEAYTDASGEYEIYLPEGTYDLDASKAGFTTWYEDDVTFLEASGAITRDIGMSERIEDFDPPVTTISGVPSGWTTAAEVAFTLSADDGVDGCGVQDTLYMIGGGEAQSYEETVTIADEGETGVTYWSIDAQGNTEAHHTTAVKIDRTAPNTSTDAVSRYFGSATINLAGADSLSGVKAVRWRLNSGAWNTGTRCTVTTQGTYTLQYYSEDNAGNVEATKSMAFSVVPKSSTAIALTSKSNSSLGYGKTFTIKGTLKSGSTGLSGKQVILQAAAPGKAFKDTSYKTTTTSGGAFTFYVKPSAKTSYKVRFAAGGAYGASTSGSVYATPKVSLSAPKAPKTMKRSKRYTVYGSLKPKHTAGTKPVRIYKYKKVGKKWVKKGYVTAKAYTYKSHTRYKVKVKLTSKGTWRLRAYAPADSLHAATWSAKYDYVKVK